MKRYKPLFKEQNNLTNLSYATKLIIEEAIKRGVKVSVADDESQLLKLEKDGVIDYFMQCVTSQNSSVAEFMVSSKFVTKKLLNQNSYSTSRYFVYGNEEDALNDYEKFSDGDYVIKPNKGSKGEGVSFINPDSSQAEYNKYVKLASKLTLDDRILIEEYISGREYRFLIVDSKCLAIIERTPPRIIGDGASSIQQLIDIKNKDKRRGDDSSYPLRKLKNGDREEITLKRKNLDFKSIPEKGDIIHLRDNANIDDGGDSIGILLEDIDYEYIKLAEDIAHLFQVNRYSAVDIKIEDIKNYIDKNSYSVIEVNAAPGFASMESPFEGVSVAVQEYVLDLYGFYKEGKNDEKI